MSQPHRDVEPTPRVLGVDGLFALIRSLLEDGRQVIAPVARDSAIMYEQIDAPEALARGWTIDAGPGAYRLSPEGTAFFDHVIGPTPWKRYLHPPRETLYRMQRDGGAHSITPASPPEDRFAFIGVRPCDLAAIGVLDRVMMAGEHPDPRYASRRSATLLIAVNCRQSAETCFCTSFDTGPTAEAGYDILLSELGQGDDTRFLAEGGSAAGNGLLARLPSKPATETDIAAAAAGSAQAAAQQTRRVETEALPETLRAAAEHSHWDDVAQRCLNCTNCTMVCPTCFCTSVEEVSDLSGEHSERQQRWDSCFTLDFSHVHGGSVRPSPKSRYRQWLTHKLGTWPEQFDGDLGCTGCGRCIAWCPVGIDLTEEIAILREPAP